MWNRWTSYESTKQLTKIATISQAVIRRLLIELKPAWSVPCCQIAASMLFSGCSREEANGCLVQMGVMQPCSRSNLMALIL